MTTTVMFNCAKKVNVCGNSVHVYIPKKYSGRKVLGVIMEDDIGDQHTSP